MIKVSAVRSTLRRMALVKCADELADIYRGIGNAYNASQEGIVGNANLAAAKSLTPKRPVAPAVVAPAQPAPRPQTTAPVQRQQPRQPISLASSGYTMPKGQQLVRGRVYQGADGARFRATPGSDGNLGLYKLN